MRLGTIAIVACAVLAAREPCFAADSTPRVFVLAMPGQPLDDALLQFAKQTDLQIGRFGNAAMAAHTVTSAVVGGFTADGALRTLLKGSGWTFRALNERAYIVVKEARVHPLQNSVGNIMNKNDARDQAYAYLLAGSLSLLSTAASAQTTAATPPAPKLEEIIVTAEHRVKSLQQTPASVTVRTGRQLQQQGKFSLSQILEDVPGVSTAANTGAAYADTDAPGTNITIRGIGSNAPLGGTINSVVPATAAYVDDVVSGIGGGYDIDQVAVLRGPQGTLYGRSATAGVVDIHTRNPTLDHLSGDALVELGNYSTQHYSAALNLPLNSVFALRLSANRYSRDGYYASKGDALDQSDGRIRLLYQPNADLSVMAGYAAQDNNTHSGQLDGQVSAPDALTYTATPIGASSSQGRQYWLEAKWNLGPATLTYIPALRTWNESGTEYVLGGQLLRQQKSTPLDHFITQELRMASKAGSLLQWQGGLYYYDNKLRNNNLVQTQNPFDPSLWSLAYNAHLYDKTTTDLGVFGEATYNFGDEWSLTGGLRYDDSKITTTEDYTSTDAASFPPTLVNLNIADNVKNFYNVTYKARLEKRLTPRNLVYASVSTGFLPGDINVSNSTSGPSLSSFASETLTSYELGSKNRFLDGRLQVNGSAYYYNYGGLQIGGVNVGSSNNASSLDLVTLVSPAKMIGGEIETTVLPTFDDRVGLNLQYDDAYFSNPSAEFSTYVVQKRVPGSSPFSADLSYSHQFALFDGQQIEVGGDMLYHVAYDITTISQSDVTQRPSLGALVRTRPEAIGNIHATWSLGTAYSFSAYVRNLANIHYLVTGQSVPGAPGTDILDARYSDPRTYGFVANYSF